jgi:hypothetical protein
MLEPLGFAARLSAVGRSLEGHMLNYSFDRGKQNKDAGPASVETKLCTGNTGSQLNIERPASAGNFCLFSSPRPLEPPCRHVSRP